MKFYNYYLFDVDGTLLETTELIYQSFAYACKEFANQEISREQFTSLIGSSVRTHMETYLGPLSDEDYRKIYEMQQNFQLTNYTQYLKLFPNVAKTLKILKSGGKHLAVVSARRKPTLHVYLQATGIYDLFEVIVSPEMTDGRNKPDPEPALKALALMNGSVGQALLIGDTEVDIECGNRAGMDTVFVLWSHKPLDSLNIRPTMVIDDMRGLVHSNCI